MSPIGKNALIFLGGVLFGTAGVKMLASKDAKKAYTHCTAAALRAKDEVMKTVTKVQENAEDIYAEAKPSILPTGWCRSPLSERCWCGC